MIRGIAKGRRSTHFASAAQQAAAKIPIANATLRTMRQHFQTHAAQVRREAGIVATRWGELNTNVQASGQLANPGGDPHSEPTGC